MTGNILLTRILAWILRRRRYCLMSRARHVADLETTDIRRLLEAGFKYPEPFHVKANDGFTDIYGVMYQAFRFRSQQEISAHRIRLSRAANRKRGQDFHARAAPTSPSPMSASSSSKSAIAAAIRIVISGTKLSATAICATTVSPIRKPRPNSLPPSILILISTASASGDTAAADS